MEEHGNEVKEKKKEVIIPDELLEEKRSIIKEPKMKEKYVQINGHIKGGQHWKSQEYKNVSEDVQQKEHEKYAKDVEIEGLQNTEEDIESESSDIFAAGSDGEETSASGSGDETKSEVLTDAEIEELVSEFLEVESKAAEAQESLEKESLAQVESEVREELAQNLHGEALELAVSSEMKTFIEEWDALLDDLENQSSLLLEQLDGAGIELPSLYKWIESQVPGGCCTEAWKKRAHWVGSQVSSELNQSIRDAEDDLQSRNPVKRKHGKLLEEGASGFLTRKLSIEDKDNYTESSQKSWSSFIDLIQPQRASEGTSFGSKNWASVYLANTPRQAANLGITIPGVDEVEEIGEIECDPTDPYYADAIANEGEIDLSEVQRKNFRKVKEEDDANLTRKLQRQLKRRRQRKRGNREKVEKDVSDAVALKGYPIPASGKPSSSETGIHNTVNGSNLVENLESDMNVFDDKEKENSNVDGNCKRLRDSDDVDIDGKRCRTVIIDSDDDMEPADASVSNNSGVVKDDLHSPSQVKRVHDIIDVDILPSSSSNDHDFCSKDDENNFRCTVCFEILRASKVRKHPQLQVIVCESCKLMVEEKMKLMDPISGGFCMWCGKCNELLSCNSCKMLFCRICITRNFDEECLSEAKASSWQCCCCSPALLHRLKSDCEKALGCLVLSSSDSDSEHSDATINISSDKRRRNKRIRRILDDAELGEETKKKIAIEKARQEHLKSMQVQSASKSLNKNVSDLSGIAAECPTAGVLGDVTEGFIVNVAREEDEEPVRIPRSLSAKLKFHQVSGIRFMWENIIQSVRKVRSGDEGLGCILAHTMGLGKTFQVIAFLYTAMRTVDLGLKTALIVTPVNVLHNWRHEFLKWKPAELTPLRVLMLEDVSRENRARLLSKWRSKGGVLLIGYAAFRNLSLGRHVKDRNIANEISNCLQYGPDILVCDEAHMIKNKKADITKALTQVKTQRRIALTGSPLQNNLMEYYCMVEFVREGYLGNSAEFQNRFQNPIQNGQHANSTAEHVKTMNERSHILYEQLKGFVQRMDMSVVKNDLPPKTVYVITVKLSPLQRKLYKKFLDVHGFSNDKVSSDGTFKRCFFTGYQALAQICNHPGLLQMAKEHKGNSPREDAVENFLFDDSSSDDNVENSDVQIGEKQKAKHDILHKKGQGISGNEEIDWWQDIGDEKIYEKVDYSGKMILLLDILSMSSEVGDKALVFSQSLATLNIIELYLSKLSRKGSEGKYWKQGKDWYRLDGSTDGSERQKLVERFNDPKNRRVKCTLISTRAGSLGINLHAANRVILVDGSWNPTHDLQAIFRVWRYGQIKPVYAYRLIAHRTMEEKIYKRQVTKEGLAARVVDRQQIHRTMSKEEILHLFDFGGEEIDLVDRPENLVLHNPEKSSESLLEQKPLSVSNDTTDKIMESLLSRHHPRWIANYHEHETLLQEDESERLTKEEQDKAWQTYQRSLEWEEVRRTTIIENNEQKPVTAHVTIPENNASRQTEGSSRNHPEHNATRQRKKNSKINTENNASQQTKGSSRSHSGHQRKCSNLDHLLTLRSRNIKSGENVVCEQCSQEIGWENLHRDAKLSR